MSKYFQPRFLIAAVAAFLLMLPVPLRIVEEWTVRVVDQHDVPVSGVRVSGSWRNYTFDLSGGSDRYTDSNGKVVFPKQTQFLPIGYWLAKPAWTLLHLQAHASFGSRGRVWISDPIHVETASANCANADCTVEKLKTEFRVALR